MFCDEVTIRVTAGKGGDGAVTFRREKYVPRGGPSGGSGGRGGDVYLVSDTNLFDLSHLTDQINWRAKDGGNGESNNKHGANGDDLFIKVPVGVSVYLEAKDNLLAELLEPGQELLVAKGGRGGIGNANFANSRRQTPHIATGGDQGVKAKLIIELKVLGDVGLVGMPNAGKSTLLSAISRATPKIGDYPFTTLDPMLGVVNTSNWERFTVADIPGLIEGASEGKGLGHEFLRHVERCRVLLYLIDLSSAGPVNTLKTLWNEIKLYSEATFDKPAFVAGNKVDLVEGQDDPLQDFVQARKIPYFRISAKEKIGLDGLIEALLEKVKATPKPVPQVAEQVIVVSKDLDELKIDFDGEAYIVKSRALDRIVAKTDIESLDGMAFVQRQMERLGVEKKLRANGAKDGDTVAVGGKRFVLG